MKTGAITDYIVLGVFFFILIGIGFYFARRMKGGKDYFSSGNKLPWWASGISMYVASFSAWTFTGAAGFVYHTEWFGIIYFATWSLAYFIGSQLVAARWRRARVISPVEYTRIRYNKTTQQVIGYVILLNALVTLGVALAAVSKIIAPALNVSVESVIVVSGIAILIYTYLGGLWAVAVADVVQFIILVSITIIILPLSISAAGGFSSLINNLGPVNFNQTYKGEDYSVLWLIAVIFINIFGSGNQGQRFYSVKDERSARKVGLTCAALFITIPILFGIPPLVAKVLWPDLSQVPFFQSQVVPSESVFIAVVLQILPNGLIGIFLAAMLAATFSSLDSAYNSTAAILAKDLYGGVFKPGATDIQIMKFGRVATFIIGTTTIFSGILYVNSSFGLFNWTMTFVALNFLPMTIPLVLGLIFKKAKRWSGLTTMIYSLLLSAEAKYVVGVSFGYQILFTAIFSIIFLPASEYLSAIYKRNKKYSILISILTWILFTIIFVFSARNNLSIIETSLMYLFPIFMGVSIYFVSMLFAKETEEDERTVSEFFKKLQTPVDLCSEVYSKGVKEVSTFPIVGKLTIIIGCLIALLAFVDMTHNEIIITLSFSGVLIIIGFLMSFFGGRSEKKYFEKMQAEIKKRGL